MICELLTWWLSLVPATEPTQSTARIDSLEQQLVQSEKMAFLGKLTAGIAFYAVQQRAKTDAADYRPEVRASTQRMTAGSVEIKIYDNGTGISEAVRQDIFKPFFTTKPTTEGTGQGLSLSYDIVTQCHHGTHTVDSQEGVFTEFTMCLPG